MSNYPLIGDPQVTFREQRLYVGIRAIAPFNGMFAVRDELLNELRPWVQKNGIADEGPYFLRYHVIDMNNQMDIEVGFVTAREIHGSGRVAPGILPAGHYASLLYTRYGMRANKALIHWARKEGVRWDRWDDPAGDAFRCRYEAYLTDYRIQPRKSEWEVELAIKIADS